MDGQVDITCTFLARSGRAILIEVDGQQEWIPTSQVSEASVDLDDVEEGQTLTITIPEWLAEERELI
jgi:hypothetical protein